MQCDAANASAVSGCGNCSRRFSGSDEFRVVSCRVGCEEVFEIPGGFLRARAVSFGVVGLFCLLGCKLWVDARGMGQWLPTPRGFGIGGG